MPEADNKGEYNQDELQYLLPIYYKRIFPHKPFYRWLSYGLCKFAYNTFESLVESLRSPTN